MDIQYGVIGSQESLLAEVHRQELLRDAGADREDVHRHLLDLRRSRERAAESLSERLAGLRRRLKLALAAAVFIALTGCGAADTLDTGDARPDTGLQPAGTTNWHVTPVEGSPEATAIEIANRSTGWLDDETCAWRRCSEETSEPLESNP